MKRAILVARGELTLLLRSRVAALGLGTLLALSAIAAATSYAHMAGERSVRSAQQQATDDLFAAQPARHPHRVVHYGSFAHRPLGVLAAFDPGVDRYTGTTLYLEGHRQNAAAFGAARESSGLIRFGELTPAFVLQVLTPLLLVFMGFPMVARERENGSLVPLRALGVQPGELLLGKALALAALPAQGGPAPMQLFSLAVVDARVRWAARFWPAVRRTAPTSPLAQAVCNDGSPGALRTRRSFAAGPRPSLRRLTLPPRSFSAGFYFSPANDTEKSNLWLIYLEGGQARPSSQRSAPAQVRSSVQLPPVGHSG